MGSGTRQNFLSFWDMTRTGAGLNSRKTAKEKKKTDPKRVAQDTADFLLHVL